MNSLAKEYIIVDNGEEYIDGDVVVIDQSDGAEYILEEAEIEEEREEPKPLGSNENTQTISKRIWTKPAIKLMLCLVEDILPDVGTTSKLPTKGEMYKYVAKEMTKEGYSFTATQVENKFRGIEKTYKKKQLLSQANDMIERKSSSKKKRKPESISDNDETKSDAEVVWMHCDEPELSNQDQSQFQIQPHTSSRAYSETQSHQLERTTEDDFPSTVMRHKISNSPRLKIFAKMASERKTYHDNLLAFFKENDLRGRKREERDQKNLELLESILDQKT